MLRFPCAIFSLVLLFVFIATCAPAMPPASGGVNGAQGHALITSLGAKLLILDVRTPEEFNQGHVPGAVLIPVQELAQRLGELPTDSPVLLICRTGRRVRIAYDILVAARPRMLETGLWYLAATPVYKTGGTFVFP